MSQRITRIKKILLQKGYANDMETLISMDMRRAEGLDVQAV